VPLTFGVAEVAQVDWGEFGDVFRIGRAVHAFVLVLAYSRLLTVVFSFSQTLAAFLRCHEEAWVFVGGCTRDVWYDNAPTVVAERRGRLVRFHPRFLAYAGHHGFRPVACAVGAPQAKGRVEDAIKYLRTHFWPGRTFRDLADLNAQAQAWRDRVANQREHRVTRKIPSLHVAEERPHLLPLHAPYDTDEVRSVVVRPSCRVPFDGNRYSVPWRLVGRPLTLRADAETVSCWYDTHPVARHVRCWQRGIDVVNPAHTAGLLATKPGASPHWQVQAVEQLGPAARQVSPAHPGRHPLAPGGARAPAAPRHGVRAPPGRGRARGVPRPGHRGEPPRGAVAPAPGGAARGPAAPHAERPSAHGAPGATQSPALRCLALRRGSGDGPAGGDR